MKKRGVVILVAAVVIVFAVLAVLLLRKSVVPEKVESLRVGVLPDPICALLYVAKQQGIFKRQGLDVSLENYQTGSFAVNDLLGGKLDMVTASEFVLALQGFKREDLRTIGSICASDTIEIIARRDRGIEKPEHLKGKRVGVSKGTNSEFFLNTFLSLNGISPKEIQRVDLKPAEITAALSEGKIDATTLLFGREAIKKQLGSNAASWSAQSGRDYFELLITTREWIKARPRAVTRLLEGVIEAEVFLTKHEEDAREIVKSALGVDREIVISTWSKTRFRVRLDQDLLTLMEDEARWAMHSKVVDAEMMPNYLNLLCLEGLEKLRPDAVSVVH
jgi:ABC-type nitrate/sulfonate/bicarbonate transport system substrate-binding protein